MNAEYVSTVINGRLADALAPHGFVRNGEWFSRDADGVRQFVGVALIDYEPIFEITIVLGLRAHALESILNQFSGGTADSQTCSFNLNELAPEIEEEVVVRDKRMLKSALA